MSVFMLNEDLIKHLLKISIEAGNAILEIYDSNFSFDMKGDESPITKADIISHEIISKSLRKITPKIPVLSEESSNIQFNKRSKWETYWLIDPLDGTKEFIKKNGEFTTNIALIESNTPIFGMIHSPVLDETYWGFHNTGSYMLKGNNYLNAKKIKVTEKKCDLTIVTSSSHPSKKLNIFLDQIGNYNKIEIGSSLKFCLIAKGEADFYPRFGPTAEWDTAAGEAILRYAGGHIATFNGDPLKYNKGSSFLNPYFVASSNRDIIDLFSPFYSNL